MSVYTRDSSGNTWKVDVDTDGLLVTTLVSSVSAGSGTTVEDFLKSTMRLAGVLEGSEDPEDDDLDDALSAFNQLLGSWSTEGLLVYKTGRQTFALTDGEITQTIGDGGDFNVPRPVQIERASVVDVSDPEAASETDIEIVSSARWSSISNKSLSGTPLYMWDDGGSPQRTLSFNPIPTGSLWLALYTRSAFTSMVLADPLEFPDGYERALRFNLALDIADEWGVDISQHKIDTARQTKSALKDANSRPIEIRVDIPVCGGYRDITQG